MLNDSQSSKLERRNMDQYKQLIEAVNANTRALHGTNGDAGMCGKMDRVADDVEQMVTQVKILNTLMIGDTEDSEDIGFKGKMLSVMTTLKQTKKLFWASIAMVATGAIQMIGKWIIQLMEYVNNLPPIPPTGTPMP